jgi:hypothetical protein
MDDGSICRSAYVVARVRNLSSIDTDRTRASSASRSTGTSCGNPHEEDIDELLVDCIAAFVVIVVVVDDAAHV